MTINLDNALGVHPSALALRAQRMEMLASNVANADTPGYQARDIDFAAALSRAENTQRSGQLTATASGHYGTNASAASASRLASGDQDLLYRTPSAASLDDNTVDVQREQAEIARNNVMFQASLRFTDSRFKGLITALKGE
ncbi:MAG: flagellar basal body rod protein FlgB [Pseudomonadaceae bacterium]|nr:flagellar basal body rod protein FlgB [Pseudomonadaceae bacterium]